MSSYLVEFRVNAKRIFWMNKVRENVDFFTFPLFLDLPPVILRKNTFYFLLNTNHICEIRWGGRRLQNLLTVLQYCCCIRK